MLFNRLILMLLLSCAVSRSTGQNQDYFRTFAGADFRNPFFWTPVQAPFFGPGGATDRVHFDLGQNFANLYTVTNVIGVNERLIIENDSVMLDIVDYETVGMGGGGNSGIIVGQSSGDTAIAVFSGDAGAQLRSVSSSIGNNAGSTGSAIVSGTDFVWLNSNLLRIGSQGNGNLVVANGGTLSSFTTDVGFGSGSNGSVLVDGNNSLFQALGNFGVGSSGTGAVRITDSARLVTGLGVIGRFPGSTGDVVVEENGNWALQGNQVVGREGNASLTVQSGGLVNCDFNGIIGRLSGSEGIVVVTGTGSIWDIEQSLSIGGDVDPQLENGGTGTLDIQAGGAVCVTSGIFLFPNGTLNLNGGATLSADSINFQGGGEFNYNSGTLHVDTYNGDLTNSAGTLAPGNVPLTTSRFGGTTILGDYQQQQFARLAIDIGGPPTGTGVDFVSVTGNAFLDGQLRVQLFNGFLPSNDQLFTIFNASPGNLFGFFDNVGDNQRLQTVDGAGSFLVRYGVTSPVPNQITLSDFQPDFILGDVNGDGAVDLLDVAPFVAAIATGPYIPAADINMDGEVNLLDVALFVALLTG